MARVGVVGSSRLWLAPKMLMLLLQMIVAPLALGGFLLSSASCCAFQFTSSRSILSARRLAGGDHAALVAFRQQPRPAAALLRRSRPRLCAEKKQQDDEKQQQGGGILNFLLNPYESKIPKEIEKDIYAAEANTPAAKERGQRIALYAVLAFVGILCAFFNGFLTELRADVDLDEAGFGWVASNLLWNFLFTNKIGGLLCLLGGGAAGLLAEAEYDTRRINAEKIFEELQRRRAEKEAGGSGKSNRKRALPSKKKKRLSGKEQKRMGALSEVVMLDDEKTATTTTPTTSTAEETAPSTAEAKKEESEPAASKKDEKGGIFGTIKGFYEKADSMAASQALLLNKKLEDQGLIEKITDESGLKVIGKEEAAKLEQQPAEKEEKNEAS